MGRRYLASLALLVACATGCSDPAQPDCVIPPCPMPMAIMVSVTSATGGPVPALTVTLSGTTSGSGQCNAGPSASSCVVPGMPGPYTLQFAASGFQPKAVSVTVSGSTPACGCTSVQTQQLDVVLTPE